MRKNDESHKISAWYIEATNYKPGPKNFPECAWSNRRRKKRHVGDLLLVIDRPKDEKRIWMYTKQFKWKEVIA